MLFLIWADEKYNTKKNPSVVFATQKNPSVFHRPFGQNVRPKKILRTPPSLKYVSGAPGVDNQGAINLAKNPVNHQRSKHIDIKYHFIRSEIQNGNVKLQYVRTDNNVADIFTKPATRVKLEKFKNFIFGS